MSKKPKKNQIRLTEDLEADSLDAVELNMALEDACGVSIPDEELAKLNAWLQQNVGIATQQELDESAAALRRAREALEELSNQLAGELSRQNPQAASEQPQDESPRGEPSEGVEPSGEPQQPAEEPSPSRNPSEQPSPPSGEQPGQSPSQGEPAENQPQQPGQPNGQQPPSDSPPSGQPGSPGNQPGQSPSSEGQPSEAGQPGQPQSPSNAPGQPSQSGQPQSPSGSQQPNSGGSRGGFERAFQEGMGGSINNVAPIGGDDFVEWSDRSRLACRSGSDPRPRPWLSHRAETPFEGTELGLSGTASRQAFGRTS